MRPILLAGHERSLTQIKFVRREFVVEESAQIPGV